MLKLKSLLVVFLVILFVNCSQDEPVGYDDGKPLVSAIEIGNSEIPYVKITTATTILNEPKNLLSTKNNLLLHKHPELDIA